MSANESFNSLKHGQLFQDIDAIGIKTYNDEEVYLCWSNGTRHDSHQGKVCSKVYGTYKPVDYTSLLPYLDRRISKPQAPVQWKDLKVGDWFTCYDRPDGIDIGIKVDDTKFIYILRIGDNEWVYAGQSGTSHHPDWYTVDYKRVAEWIRGRVGWPVNGPLLGGFSVDWRQS